MGDKAKPLVSSPGPAALLSMNSAFLCWPSLRENSKCSQIILRLTVKGRWTNRPPYGQKDANFGLDPRAAWVSRPFFLARKRPTAQPLQNSNRPVAPAVGASREPAKRGNDSYTERAWPQRRPRSDLPFSGGPQELAGAAQENSNRQ